MVIIMGLHYRYYTGVQREHVGWQDKSRLILHGRKAVLGLEGCIPGEKEGKTIQGRGGWVGGMPKKKEKCISTFL